MLNSVGTDLIRVKSVHCGHVFVDRLAINGNLIKLVVWAKKIYTVSAIEIIVAIYFDGPLGTLKLQHPGHPRDVR